MIPLANKEIQNAYQFCESFAKSKTAVKKDRFTQLLLVHIVDQQGDRLEFVKRYSFRGLCMRVISWFNKEDKTFDIDANISLANKLFERVMSKLPMDDEAELENILKGAGIREPKGLHIGKEFKANYKELDVYLKQLQHRVERSRSKVKHEFQNPSEEMKIETAVVLEKEKLPLYTKPVMSVFEAFSPQYKEKHKETYSQVEKFLSQKLLKYEVDAVIDSVVQCVDSSANEDEIIQKLKQNDPAPLQFALRKSLALSLPKEHLAAIRKVLAAFTRFEGGFKGVAYTAENFSSFIGSVYGRGSIDGIPFDIAKTVLADFLKAKQQEEAALLVTESIHISEKSETVFERLQKNGHCNILGGYEGNPMVFAIQKQGSNNYTLQVYTKGSETLNPPELLGSSELSKGYIEITGITKDKLSEILKNLKTFRQTNQADAERYLESLNGKKVAGSEYIQSLLDPHKSGALSSHALLARVAGTMTSEGAHQTVNGFDSYLLDAFRIDLENKVGKEVVTEADFLKTHNLVASIRHTLEECSERFAARPDAQEKLALYTDILDRFDQKLLAYQKATYQGPVVTLDPVEKYSIKILESPKVPKPAKAGEKKKIAPIHIELKDRLALDAMKMQNAEQALETLSNINPASSCYLYICEVFFQKIGSLEALKTLSFADRQKAIDNFRTILKNLSSSLDAENPEKSQAERYGIFLLATYGFEEAFRKLPSVVSDTFPSSLATSTVCQHVQALRTSSPFWTERFKEILNLSNEAQRTAANDFVRASLANKTITLSETLAESIDAWAKNPEIANSIKADRDEQERLIKAQVNGQIGVIRTSEAKQDEFRANIAQCEAQKNTKTVERDELLIINTSLEAEKKRLLLEKKEFEAKYKSKLRSQDTVKIANEEALKKNTQKIEKAEAERDINLAKISSLNDEIKQIEIDIKKEKEKIAQQEKIIDGCLIRINNHTRKERDPNTGKLIHLEHVADWAFGGIARDVLSDPKFWPWGILESDKSPDPWGPGELGYSEPSLKPWNAQQVAAFFLGSHKYTVNLFATKLGRENPLPVEFRNYLDVVLLARNIFYKVKSDAFTHTSVIFNKETFALRIGETEAKFNEQREQQDFYRDGLENMPSYKDLYINLYSKPYKNSEAPVEELHIPSKVASGLSTIGEEAPGKIKRGLRWLMSGPVELQDTMRDLCQLHCSKELQITSAISFFRENPKRLFTEEGRLLFHALLFESDLLASEFANTDTQTLVVNQLRFLIQDVINSAIAQKKSDPEAACETYANMIWLGACCQKYLNSCPPKQKQVVILEADDIIKLAQEVAGGDFKKERPILFEAVIAACGLLLVDKVETEDEKKLFIYGQLARVLLNREPLEKVCAPRAHDAVSADIKLRYLLEGVTPLQLQAMFKDYGQQFLATVYKHLEKVEFKADEAKRFAVLESTDKNVELSLSDATIIPKDEKLLLDYTDPLPSDVKKLLCEQGLYKNEAATVELRCYKSGSTYFISDKAIPLLLQVEKGKIFVQVGDKYYFHVRDKQASSHDLLGSYHQWYNPDTKITYLADKNTLKPIFETDVNGNILKKQEDGTILTLGKPADTSLLNDFEDPNWTLYWVDAKNTIQEVEFPRLGISLQLSGDTYCLSGAPEWKVTNQQYIPSFTQKSGFLVLGKFKHDNNKQILQETKVLLPRKDLLTDVGHKEVRYDFESGVGFGRYLESSIIDDKLVPKSAEARYQLVRLFLAQGNLDMAEELLYSREARVTSRKLVSRSDFDDKKLTGAKLEKHYREELKEEVELLKSIAFSPEEVSPRAIRLKMYALYILKKNQEQFPKEALREEPLKKIEGPSVDELKEELALLEQYVVHVKDQHPLEPDEELLLFDNTAKAYLKERYQENRDDLREKLSVFFDPELMTVYRELKTKEADDKKTAQLASIVEDVSALKVDLLFDPREVNVAQFNALYPILAAEVKKIGGTDCIERSALFAALTIASQSSRYQEVQKQAVELLKLFPIQTAFLPPRIKYDSYRTEGRLPFNPLAVKSQEFNTYRPFIIEEVASIQSKEAAERSGLLSALATVVETNKDHSVRQHAQSLLDVLATCAKMSPEEQKASLYSLGVMQAMTEDRGYLRNLREQYFTKLPKAVVPVVSETLFATNAPEILKKDNVTEQKFKSIAEDVEEARVKLAEDSYELKIKKPDGLSEAEALAHVKLETKTKYTELKDRLEAELIKERKLLAYQETLIVNSVAQALSADPKLAHEFRTKKRHYPTMEEIAFLCARKNYHESVEKTYPQLNSQGREALRAAVKKYFFQKETVQQLDRSVKAATDFLGAENESEMTKQSYQDVLANEMAKVRAYPSDHPHAMIFLFLETALNLKLRSDQVKNIVLFDEGITGDKDYVLQMIMGAGKTAVIQPLLAILLAKPGTLSSVMVPEALFPAVRDILVESLGSTADQMLMTFPYDVELSQDVDYLDTLIKRLEEVVEKGGTVLLSKRIKDSIMASFYEVFELLTEDETDKADRIVAVQNEIEKIRDKQAKTTETFQKIEKNYQSKFKETQTTLERLGIWKTKEGEEKRNELKRVFDEKKSRYENLKRQREEKIGKLQVTLSELRGRGYEEKLEMRAEKICELCSLLKYKEALQMDEIHRLLSPDVLFKRPTGKPVVFEAETGFAIPKFLTDLMFEIAADKKLNEGVSIDFANKMLNTVEKGEQLNDEIYQRDVKPRLVEHALTHLAKHNLILREAIAKNKEVIKRYIEQNLQDGDKELFLGQKGLLQDNEVSQELLYSAAHAINDVLSTSLQRICKVNYSKDVQLDSSNAAKRKYIARPYECPDSQKPTMYADPLEKQIYSIQYYLNEGIPLNVAREMLIEWQHKSKEEVKGGHKGATAWFVRFNDLGTGKDFNTDPKSADFENVAIAFQQKISKDTKSLKEFLEKRLYEQNTQYTKDVECTPQTLAGSSARVFGYTGTMHEAILAPSMEAIPEKGTDGKTISAMENKFKAGVASVITMKKDANLPKELISTFHDPATYVVTDSGDWLKDVKIDTFVEDLYRDCLENRKDIKGIVYHDSNNKLRSYEPDEKGNLRSTDYKDSKLKPEERLTIIRRKFETGTNIPQKLNAKCRETIRKDMQMPDMLQSAFRMRKILQGQSVDLLISYETKIHIAQQLLRGILSHIGDVFTEGQPIDIGAFEKAIESLAIHKPLLDQLKAAIMNYNAQGKEKYTILALQGAFGQEFIPDSESCWRYFAANIAKVEQKKNWAATRFKMREAFEEPIRKILFDKKTPLKERKALAKAVKDGLFVKKEPKSRFTLLLEGKKLIPREEAVAEEMQKYIDLYNSLKKAGQAKAISEGIIKQLDLLLAQFLPEEDRTTKQSIDGLQEVLTKCYKLEELPEFISKFAAAGELEAEEEQEVEEEDELQLEQEEEVEEEVQQEEEQEAAKIPQPDTREYEALLMQPKGSEDFYNINSLFDPKLFPKISAALPEALTFPGCTQIEFTKNFIPPKGKDTYVKLDTDEYAKNQLSARYVLALKEKDTPIRYILVSNIDAEKIRRGLLKGTLDSNLQEVKDKQREAILIDLNGGAAAQSNPYAESSILPQTEADSILVQIKFLTAKPSFTSIEVEKLDAIILQDKDPQKLRKVCRDYYKTRVFGKGNYEYRRYYLETAAKSYPNSYLEEMLNK